MEFYMPLQERASRIIEQASRAFSAKAPLDSFWQDAAELHFPEHADFTTRKLEDDHESTLYDSTPALFRRDFANWMGSVLRPKGQQWFKQKRFGLHKEDDTKIRSWLEKRDEVLRSLMYAPKSQFISQMNLADHQYVTFGNSVTSCEPRQRKGLLYRTWHLRDCAWLEDADGEVNALYRKFKLKVVDLISKEKEGWKIPQQIKEKYPKQMLANVNVMHAEMPIDWFYGGDKPKDDKADYVSVYLCSDTNDLLFSEERKGFRYAVSRWFRLPNSPYALSPCVTVSNPDSRTLQSMTWSIMQAGELAVEPPLVGQSETVMGPVNIFPGGVTWLDNRYDERAGQGLRPLDMGKVPELGISLHQGIKESLGSAWYLNKLFLPPPEGEMTATEIERRHQEFMRAAQPIIEPAEPERNGRILDVSMETAMNLGFYGAPDEFPEELLDTDIDFAYENPVESARQLATTSAFERSLQVTEGAAAVNPSVRAVFDIGKAHRDTLNAIAPADWVRDEDDEELQAAQQQIQKDQQEQAAMNQAQQGSEIAGNLAKAEDGQAA